jgi:hypothetical protein
MVGILSLPPSPPMPYYGDLLACRTNANHLAGLAFGAVPWDKYNHCGGEGLFRITAPTLSGWPPSLPTGSQLHLEEKSPRYPPALCHLRLAGKPVTAKENLFSFCLQSHRRFLQVAA